MDQTLDAKLVSQPIETIKSKKRVRSPPCSSSYALVSYKELPEYMKDNEFILNYYRANWPLKEALFSIFRWHNETLNVWTHLLGFVLFLGLTMVNLFEAPPVSDLIAFFTRSFPTSGDIDVYQDLVPGTSKFTGLNRIMTPELDLTLAVTPVTRWPFYVFLAGSMFCLLSSSIYHLFSCHSHHMNMTLSRIDYTGITTMIITSFFPPIYYAFQCDPIWHYVYLGGIMVLGLFTIVTLLSSALSTNKFRAFRAMLFASMGFFGLVPGIHAAVINWSNPRLDIILAYEAAMAIFYLTGTMFYVTRIPERFRPGWFDLTGHSHQIFHVFVVMGALAHYGASLVFLDLRDHHSC